MKRRILVVVNPASGKDEAVLAQLNRGFGSEVDWDIVLTQAGNEAEVAARLKSAAADLIGIYGGDGTVTRIVSALGTPPAPIVIFPGGTANSLADELGSTLELEEIARRIAEGRFSVRAFDIGRAGSQCVLVRVSIGLAAGLTQHADRSQKDRFGKLAYVMSSIQALREATPIRYRLELDGRVEELDAVAAIVANVGGVGMGLPSIGDVDPHDARLDVIVFPSALGGLTKVVGNAAQAQELVTGFPRWTARRVSVETAEPQAVHIDGEECGQTPLSVEARASAIQLVVFEAAS